MSRWVCLMYHDVAAGPVGVSGGPGHFSVPRASFENHLDLIRRLGLDGGTIARAAADRGATVAISFDDGDSGQVQFAFPALVSRGMTATFFVVTDWIGRTGYATWDQLRTMRAAGMSIQSHTHSHPFLSELDHQAVLAELCRSKALLDAELGQETDTLALPGGDYPRRARPSVFAEAGYRTVATSRWGINDEPAAGVQRVLRCTLRGDPPAEYVERVVRGDGRLAARRALRDAVLAMLHTSLGRSRYARWRRRFLEALAHGR